MELELRRAGRRIFTVSISERLIMSFVAVDTRAASRAVGLTMAVTLAALGAMFALHHNLSSHAASTALLWIVMTVGMMAPTAISMVATFARMSEKLDPSRSAFGSATLFLSAYIMLWSVYAVIAAALQME